MKRYRIVTNGRTFKVQRMCRNVPQPKYYWSDVGNSGFTLRCDTREQAQRVIDDLIEIETKSNNLWIEV